MTETIVVRWADVDRLSDQVLDRNPGVRTLYGIPTGGSVVAARAAGRHGLGLVDRPPDTCDREILVIDDLADSGATLAPWLTSGWRVDALIRKPCTPPQMVDAAHLVDGWVAFPWEHDGGLPVDAVVRLLQFVGEDPTRDGLVDTPRRVTRALEEMTAGYRADPGEVLSRTFAVDCDEMVALRGIRFASLCEHHLLPFTGRADVVYVPGKRVVGISKLARLVDCFARRLQVQERMTQQIAAAIQDHLDPRGVAVVVRAHHHCMGCRGVGQPEAEMVTSALTGLMLDDHKARSEALSLCGWNGV